MLRIEEQLDMTADRADIIERYEQLTATEWLLTNKRGSFAGGSLSGANTRKYHCLLAGSLNPPTDRTVALAGCAETISFPDGTFSPVFAEFDPPSPEPLGLLPGRFSKDVGVHFAYRTDRFDMTKSIYLLPDSDIVAICYEFADITEQFDFMLRPLTAMRDYHATKRASDDFDVDISDEFIVVKNRYCSGELLFFSDDMTFARDSQWWYNFLYRRERERGFECAEDLFSPGLFRRTIDGPVRIVLWAGFGDSKALGVQMSALDVDVVIDDLKLRQKNLLAGLKTKDPIVRSLAASAEQFIIDRGGDRDRKKSIIAGYPWFMDWGRDAFIALEGLLLRCGRFSDAADVLINFADNADEGMIPNCFGDYHSGAQYNSIDASLWFIHAAFRYYKTGGDSGLFTSKLLPVIRWIVDSYSSGTKYYIKADDDGLISGGDVGTQLTWMDAKSGSEVFTPRYGKAVEVNALWYNAVCHMAEYYRSKDAEAARRFSDMADRIAASFGRCFWNASGGYLYDYVTAESSDASIRPNQILAVSLPFSPLTVSQQRAVVSCVEQNLLTPYGLRTLSPEDKKYRPRYQGDPYSRDSAYHQGTVWPWLIGPFVEAYLKVNNSDRKSKKRCGEFIYPLLEHFKNDGCIGSVSEIFDGDSPHKPRGAFAQAWSVAELLRAQLLING